MGCQEGIREKNGQTGAKFENVGLPVNHWKKEKTQRCRFKGPLTQPGRNGGVEGDNFSRQVENFDKFKQYES